MFFYFFFLTAHEEIMRTTFKTTRGEQLDLDLPPGCSVSHVVKTLVERYGYAQGVSIMSGTKVLDGHSIVEDSPAGSLMIVGTLVSAPRRGVSPQSSTMRATHHHARTHATPSKNVDTEHAPPPSHGAAPSPSSQRSSSRASSPQPGHLATPITIRGVIPQLHKSVDIPLPGHATVADLVVAANALDTRLIGCKIVFRGKVATNPEAPLHTLGIRDGDAVHLATGVYTDLNVLNLFRIKEDFARLQDQISSKESGAGAAGLTDIEKKAFYEELMRVLFRTDELQELEGDLRQERKDLVRRITELQDTLKV